MKDIFKTYLPTGFHTVTPYVFAKDANELLEFLSNAFFAEEFQRTVDPETKAITNAMVKMGDTCFMVSQSRQQFDQIKSSFYLYTADVDLLYKRALKFGAQDILAPADMDYGDRQAGVIDPQGNYWWISKRLKEEDY